VSKAHTARHRRVDWCGLEERPDAVLDQVGIARGRRTRGAGAQDAGKIARALLRLQFERFFDWNSATGFETSLLPDLSQVDGTAIAARHLRGTLRRVFSSGIAIGSLDTSSCSN